MRTNTDCTVYNQYRNEQTGQIEIHRTYLSAVFWESRKAINVISSGLSEADRVGVFIPLSVNAENKLYLDPVKYNQLPPDQVKDHWTLSEGQDYLVIGNTPEAPSMKELKEILATSNDSFKITSVDPKLYGGLSLRHWEVSGK